ncbi:hypothetical protein [Lacrimispora indolis]|uniref:hypothetical protein n=1 Tax=Lacrimispora indolis TaxID=69825 RepID=UPI0004142006|nr:hypothetical protein [[Clostridium] methoxybenzovorans]
MEKVQLFITTAILSTVMGMTAFAGEWKQDTIGWWYQNDGGSYPTNQWQWLDGNNDGISECYYFDSNGYMLFNTTTPDGYEVNSNGNWVVNSIVQVQHSENNQNKNKEYINPLLIEDMKSTIVELRNKYGMELENPETPFRGEQIELGFENSPFNLRDYFAGSGHGYQDHTYLFFAEETGISYFDTGNKLDTYHIEESAKPIRMEVLREKVFCNFDEWYKADEFVALLKKVGATNIKLLDKSYDYKVYYQNTGNTKDYVQHVTTLRFVYDGVWFYLDGEKGKFKIRDTKYFGYVETFSSMNEGYEKRFDESQYGKDQTSKFEIIGDPASYWSW